MKKHYTKNTSILLEWKKLQVGLAGQESDRDGQWPLMETQKDQHCWGAFLGKEASWLLWDESSPLR